MVQQEKKPPAAETADLIKKIKKRFGMTQGDIGVILGISQAGVSDYEHQKVDKIPHEIINTLRAVLDGKPILEEIRRRARELEEARAARLIRIEKAISERTGRNDETGKRQS